ncbi:hypothetical protein J5991_02595 [Methanocorpusculum sp.]|nr:hypothetical protein [Methanocorpusculum sp.]
MQRRHELTQELITLYEIVGETVWQPAQIPPELKPKIKQWVIEGHIIRISRKHSCTPSSYRINRLIIAKITADKALSENTALYLSGTLTLKDLSAQTGLETKYLSRRLTQIHQAQEETA